MMLANKQLFQRRRASLHHEKRCKLATWHIHSGKCSNPMTAPTPQTKRFLHATESRTMAAHQENSDSNFKASSNINLPAMLQSHCKASCHGSDFQIGFHSQVFLLVFCLLVFVCFLMNSQIELHHIKPKKAVFYPNKWILYFQIFICSVSGQPTRTVIRDPVSPYHTTVQMRKRTFSLPSGYSPKPATLCQAQPATHEA